MSGQRRVYKPRVDQRFSFPPHPVMPPFVRQVIDVNILEKAFEDAVFPTLKVEVK